MDTIESSNLSRQMLFDYRDKGKKKVEIAAKKLKIMNPELKIDIYSKQLQDLSISIFEEADVIAGGLDSFKARFALNKIAINSKIPYVDGGATGFKGSVQIVIPDGLNKLKRTSCLRCLYPIPPVDERIYAGCTLPGIPRSGEQCVLKAEEQYIKDKKNNNKSESYKIIADMASQLSIESQYCEEIKFSEIEVENIIGNKIPSILTINAIISGLVSHEILKIIHILNNFNIGDILNPPYLEYSSEYGIFTPIEFNRDKNCPVCGKGKEKLSINVSKNENIKKIFNKLKNYGIKIEPKETLITKEMGGKLIVSPNTKNLLDKKLYKLDIQNHDILNITYRSKGERKRIQIFIQMEEEG